MQQQDEELQRGGQRLMPEEVEPLLRAYAALALARRALQLYSDSAPEHPYLDTTLQCQELAARELDAVIEGAISGLGRAALAEAGEELSCLVM